MKNPLQWIYLYLLLFYLLIAANVFAVDEICDLPHLPVHERIENRTYPSLFSAWRSYRVENLPQLSDTERWAMRDLYWNQPPFNLRFDQSSNEWNVIGYMPYAEQKRSELLELNPNMIILAGIPFRVSFVGYYPEDFPYWLRDEEGNIVSFVPGHFLLDFTHPGMQDIIVRQALAVAQCGLYDGIMFDWWNEQHAVLSHNGMNYRTLEAEQQARDNILQRIRAQVRDDFLIIGNTNTRKIPRTAWAINGTFMENIPDTTNGYSRRQIKEIEDTLLWSEENLRSPQVNCLQGFNILQEPADGPNSRQWMRLFTTMSLTCSDGYVSYMYYSLSNHHHYAFWDADLGTPIGPKGQPHQEIEGLYLREYTNGWAVYNRSGKEQAINLPRASIGVSSNKQDITHLLPDLDGEIYLRIGKPYDLNRDGAINVLDLIIVSQHFGTAAGDINGDGETNILDLTLIAQQFRQ